MTEQMLSPTEVARRLGVSRRTVRRWIKSGVLPAYRVGGVYRIAPDEFASFLEQSRTRCLRANNDTGNCTQQD